MKYSKSSPITFAVVNAHRRIRCFQEIIQFDIRLAFQCRTLPSTIHCMFPDCLLNDETSLERWFTQSDSVCFTFVSFLDFSLRPTCFTCCSSSFSLSSLFLSFRRLFEQRSLMRCRKTRVSSSVRLNRYSSCFTWTSSWQIGVLGPHQIETIRFDSIQSSCEHLSDVWFSVRHCDAKVNILHRFLRIVTNYNDALARLIVCLSFIGHEWI
jgi:hypothetical protein